MSRRHLGYADEEDDDEDESGLDESEFPDHAEVDDDEADGTPEDECPYCGALIAADSVQCPRCRTYISEEDKPARARRNVPAWAVVTVVVLIVAIVVVWLMHGL